MKDKQQKENKNLPATKKELWIVRGELKQEMGELKKDVGELKKEMTEIKQEFRDTKQELILAMCQQTQKIIDHLDDMFKENKREHFEMRRDIKACKHELGI